VQIRYCWHDRAARQDLGLQRDSDQSQVSHQIQQLVPCWFVPEMQRLVVQDTVCPEDHRFADSQLAGNPLDFLIGQIPVHDDDGVVQVAALDEPRTVEHFHFMEEAKCAAGGDLRLKIAD